jgi:hypothetical protein
VAPVREFEQSGGLVCPKCLARDLIVGADFDFSTGNYACEDCGRIDQQLESVAHCFACHHRFPASDAEELELIGYSVQRLDLARLIPSNE